MTDEWIVIPKWDKWQSRKDRRDPWIKDWIDQLDRDEYLSLSSAERGILHDLRLVFARFNGQAKLSHFASITNSRPLQKQLDRLVQAGLLALSAAKPPPLRCGSAARGREEEEKETRELRSVSEARNELKRRSESNGNGKQAEEPSTTIRYVPTDLLKGM